MPWTIPNCRPLGQRVEHQPHRREPVRVRRARPARRGRDGCIRAHGRAAHGRGTHVRLTLSNIFGVLPLHVGGLYHRHRRRRCTRH
ncbi:MAG: hypothetical protein ACLSHG_09610 [Oscillospiraceae bacterium]